MNRNKILKLINNNNRESVLELITCYCLEKGKSINSIKELLTTLEISTIYGSRNLLEYCYKYALTYYMKEFNIIILSKDSLFIKAF